MQICCDGTRITLSVYPSFLPSLPLVLFAPHRHTVLYCRYIDFQQAKEISRLEEEFQAEIWGTVEGGHDMDRLNNTVNLSSVDSFMTVYWDQSTAQTKLEKLSKQSKLI
jgi:chaperone required for assembly of F1-ATPase